MNSIHNFMGQQRRRDLFVTNIERLKKGIDLGLANGMIPKSNMVGTLSEAMDAAHYIKLRRNLESLSMLLVSIYLA